MIPRTCTQSVALSCATMQIRFRNSIVDGDDVVYMCVQMVTVM